MSTLTIRMMVQLGPWTYLGVDDKGFDQTKWEHCEVEDCGQHIRYVHVLKRDDDPDQKEWRIGSTCGPKLEDMSEEKWGVVAKNAARILRLWYRARRLKPLEAEPENWGVERLGSDWIDRIISHLERGDVQNAKPVIGLRPPDNDLGFIQFRLRRAEVFHKLKAFKMGKGK
jgi:hypothetical protein